MIITWYSIFLVSHDQRCEMYYTLRMDSDVEGGGNLNRRAALCETGMRDCFFFFGLFFFFGSLPTYSWFSDLQTLLYWVCSSQNSWGHTIICILSMKTAHSKVQGWNSERNLSWIPNSRIIWGFGAWQWARWQHVINLILQWSMMTRNDHCLFCWRSLKVFIVTLRCSAIRWSVSIQQIVGCDNEALLKPLGFKY